MGIIADKLREQMALRDAPDSWERIMAVCGDMANCEDCPLCTLPQEHEGQECWERAVEVITFPGLYEVRHGLVRPIFDRRREGMENHPRRAETGAQKAREGVQR